MKAYRTPRKHSKRRLLFYDEIPAWQKDNEHLLSGYRPTSGSLLLSLQSLFSWHNETINIHSHTIGSALFALLPIHFYASIYHQVAGTQPIDEALFLLYFLGVALCFIFSAYSHIVWNVSESAASFGIRLDLCGIVLLMWGANLPSIHFAFICDPRLKQLHWGLVSLSALGCIISTLRPQFLGPASRKYRALTYICFGLSAVTFTAHGIFLYGFAEQRKRLALEWMGLMGFLNLAGAAFYALRIPERWFPYRFDIVGASHQIFHVLVLAAGVVHYKALICTLREVRGDRHSCTSDGGPPW